jgi:hypothetical protein
MYDRLLWVETEAFSQGKRFCPPELPTKADLVRFRTYRWIKHERPAQEEDDRYDEQVAREKAEKLAGDQAQQGQ